MTLANTGSGGEAARPAVPPTPSAGGRSLERRLPGQRVGRQPDWLVGQLPVGMLDNQFFYRFASLFQEEAGTYLDDLDSLAYMIDPAVAPPGMVRFLAGWLALAPIDPDIDELHQRRVVQAASNLRWWRGTKQGLTRLLELYTRGPVEVDENGFVGRPDEYSGRPAAVRVRVTSTGWLAEPEFVEMVRDEVPANAALELYVGERRIWPPDDLGRDERGR